ncbi:gastrin/cholecystokinin type B receptor-like [Haliotis rufescens]|uniref:gastrin/cholecystokinin type B receptor-like n=1 Tax=Haliotis rufescens TaxID=6454 RepID=UPI001EB035D3|nr:gastrin/cholecystokinin type B receptor-like [Haliotis rufescens]
MISTELTSVFNVTEVPEGENASQNSSGYFMVNYSEDNFIPTPLAHDLVVTFMVLYILIIVLALLGNLVVIVVIFLTKMMRSVTDLFVVSLAVSDLLISVLNMPFQLLSIVTNEWTMGLFMCKFHSYIQGVTIVSNILTLLAIAIDRYLVICHTEVSRKFHTKKVGWIVLFVVWFVSLIVVCPQIIVQRLAMRLKIDSANQIIGVGFLCVEFYPHPDRDSKIYTFTIYSCMYLLPVCVMAFTYGAIAHRLWVRHPIGDMLENPRNHAKNIQQKKKLTQMLMLLVVAFTVLWFPFFTASLYRELVKTGSKFRIGMAILQLIGYSNCCVNPIIYTFLNKKFQREFKRIFTKRRVDVRNIEQGQPQHSAAATTKTSVQHISRYNHT